MELGEPKASIIDEILKGISFPWETGRAAWSPSTADIVLRLPEMERDDFLGAATDDRAAARLEAAMERRAPAEPVDLGTLLSSSCGDCGGACGGHSVDALERTAVTKAEAAATPDQFARYLTTGFWTEKGEIPHSWDTTASNVITVNLTGVNAEMKALIRDALDAWETVADLQFQEVSGTADITFKATGSGATTSTVYQTNGDMVSATVQVTQSWIDANGTTTGSYSMQTYIHEIGHALGLGHAGGYSTPGGTSYSNDSWQMSVMSYNSQGEATSVNASTAVVVTPMMADIIAVQSLYGKPTGGATAGNTVYGVKSDLGTYMDDVFAGQGASMSKNALTIYDEGGRDKIDFSSDTKAQRVDLNGGTYSDVYGKKGNLAIAKGTVIEDYVGGSSSDNVTGNGAGNSLKGMNGNDVLYGRDGNDTLDGGSGNDTMTGGYGADRLMGVAGNDVMNGEAGNDTVQGGDGNDTLRGHTEMDLLQGGNGGDTLYGGDSHDRLFGDAGNDVLYGDAGNDSLAGGSGNDIMTGGSGADWFAFNSGRDTVRDFQNDVDTLQIDDALWGGRRLSIDQVLDYARVTGGNVFFDFGNGATLTVQGITNVNALANDIAII